MSIEEGNQYLSQGRDPESAYSAMDARHFLIGNTLEELQSQPLEKLQKPAGDYVSAGISFLANRVEDPLIEEVGTMAYIAMNQKRAYIAFADSVAGAMAQMGLPRENVLRALRIPNELFYTVLMREEDGNPYGLIFISPGFIHKARTNPLEALASTVWAASQIRDMENGRIPGDTRVGDRANAIEAQFLHRMLADNPHLTVGRDYRAKMEEFPRGIESLTFDI